MAGGEQRRQSSVAPPAIELKLPGTLRVDPNPITGEPARVLRTVRVERLARASLLWGLSNRCITTPPNGVATTTSADITRAAAQRPKAQNCAFAARRTATKT